METDLSTFRMHSVFLVYGEINVIKIEIITIRTNSINMVNKILGQNFHKIPKVSIDY